MSPEAQRIAIAELCGWKPETRKRWAGMVNVKGWGRNTNLPLGHPDRNFTPCFNLFPDYLRDLNACHEMENHLGDDPSLGARSEWSKYRYALNGICHRDECDPLHATAAQRCEAFLKATGRWVDEK